MRRRLGFVFCITTMCLSLNAFAGGFTPVSDAASLTPKDPLAEPLENRWFMGVGGGIAGLFFNNKVMTFPTFNPQTFTMDDITKVEGNFHVVAGTRWSRDADSIFHALSFGVEYDYFTGATVNGKREVATFNSPYSYHVAHQAILLLAKANVARWSALLPYIQVGAGLSLNCFSDFKDTTPNPATLTLPDKTSYHFAFIAGLGVDWVEAENFFVDLGYRFGYWGNVESGTAFQTQLSHAMYSNQALLTLNYMFDA